MIRPLLALLVTLLFLFWGWYLYREPLAAAPWHHWQAEAFVLPLLLVLLSHWLRASRLAAEFRNRLNWWQAWQLLAWHTFLVNLLPLRSGELALPVLLHRCYAIPLVRATATLIWLRIQDLLVVIGLALLLWPNLPWVWRLGLLLLLVAALGVLTLGVHHLRRLPWPLVRRLVTALTVAINKTRFVWHWTIANWCVKITAVAILFAELLPNAPPASALLFAALAGELGAIQPLQGIAGVGPYEAAVAAALALYAVPLAAGVAVALAAHGMLFAVSAAMALLAWIRSR